MRLLCKVGKELKPEEVEESVQKTVATSGAKSAVTIHEKLSVMMKTVYVLQALLRGAGFLDSSRSATSHATRP